MEVLSLEDLSKKDRDYLKKLISTSPEVLKDEEIRHIYARSGYISAKVLGLFRERLVELGLLESIKTTAKK